MRASLVLTSAAALLAAHASAGPSESDLFRKPVQLTFPERFVKAGESYFAPDGDWIIFQAVPVPESGATPDEHYSMYVAKIERDDAGRATGLGRSWQVSTDGSANTCGWFHPTEPGLILFGSTMVPPSGGDTPGYQRGSGNYRWAFPSEMDVVTTRVPAVASDTMRREGGGRGFDVMPLMHSKLIERAGYDAECSWSPDARFVLYANVDDDKSRAAGRPDADLWVYDTHTKKDTLLISAPGYDGGPFFSHDGSWICYRSDRRGDNLLQLFVSEIDYADDGSITGIRRELQITDNKHVNWAPFWHPTEPYLLYTTSEVGHHNYELFALRFDRESGAFGEPVRVTSAKGFDGLGVFNADGSEMMWTAQRGDDASSQLWIAEMVASPLDDFARYEEFEGLE